MKGGIFVAFTFITGASSGLGRELAIYLSRKNDLILNGRDKTRLDETKNLCSDQHKIILWPYDLKNADRLENDFADFIKGSYEIESFVHCAGTMSMSPLRSLNYEIVEEIFNVNIFSAMMIIKILASQKFNRKNLKSAVLVSSNISNRGARAFSAYGSSKAALDGLARNLAVELAPDVRVNSVLPGGMKTRMTQEIFDDEALINNAAKKYPLGMGTPADIIPTIEFLLSDSARWITGQNITIDGGRTLDITETKD